MQPAIPTIPLITEPNPVQWPGNTTPPGKVFNIRR